MEKIKAVVIGGSTGAIAVLKSIVAALPPDFAAPVLVTVHLAADFPSCLPEILAGAGKLAAAPVRDGEAARPGRIYVAPPDWHLVMEDGRVRLNHGPKENRHRPALDPMFRSAAAAAGAGVIAVVLTGQLDDGVAGALDVQQQGGLLVVQDPVEAEAPSMPRQTIRFTSPDAVLPAAEIGPWLRRAVATGNSKAAGLKVMAGTAAAARPGAAAGTAAPLQPEVNSPVALQIEPIMRPSPFACPECHGVLWEATRHKLKTFRCRVGHAYGLRSLNLDIRVAVEDTLWTAIRSLEEWAGVLDLMAEAPPANTSAARLRREAERKRDQARIIRGMVAQGEDLQAQASEPGRRKRRAS